MKFLAFIFFACALQVSIHADSIQEAIQEGNNKIAQLKSTWEKQIPEIESIIFPKIDDFAAQFAEVAAHVAKQIKDDAAKLNAAENVKVAYDAFVAESKKTTSKIAKARPDVLDKGFRGAELANAAYDKISKAANEFKQAGAGNSCKEGVTSKFIGVLSHLVNQATECVLGGGENFPVPSSYLLILKSSVGFVTSDSINMYNRCTEEIGTSCYDILVEKLNKETQNVVKSGDSYTNAAQEIALQRSVSNFCIKRKSISILQKEIVNFKRQMNKC